MKPLDPPTRGEALAIIGFAALVVALVVLVSYFVGV